MELDMTIARKVLEDKVSDKTTYPTEYLRSELLILSYQTPDALDVMAREVIEKELTNRG